MTSPSPFGVEQRNEGHQAADKELDGGFVSVAGTRDVT
jgi:hypothetical protein